MHEIALTIPPSRFRSALETGSARGLVPPSDNTIQTMSTDEIRVLVERLIFMMLAPELNWIEERDIPCSIRLTDAEGTFIFAFERLGDALLFQAVWGDDEDDED